MSFFLSQFESVGKFLNSGPRFIVNKIGHGDEMLSIDFGEAINHLPQFNRFRLIFISSQLAYAGDKKASLGKTRKDWGCLLLTNIKTTRHRANIPSLIGVATQQK